MTAVLPAQLAKLIPRLGSNQDGEVVATARAIERTLLRAGFDLHDLAAALHHEPQRPAAIRSPSPPYHVNLDWRATVRRCFLFGAGMLSEREIEFLESLNARPPGSLSPRQAQWLADIEQKLRRSA